MNDKNNQNKSCNAASAVNQKQCNLVEDLMVLYQENMLHDSTKEMVEEHLAVCPDCQKKLNKSAQQQSAEQASVKMLEKSRRSVRKSIQQCSGIIISLILTVFFFTAFAVSQKHSVPWSSQKIMLIEKDGFLELSGPKGVDFSFYQTDDGEYFVEGWTSAGSMLMNRTGTLVFNADDPVYYVSNNDQQDIPLTKAAKQTRMTLPRLALRAYDFAAAVFGFICLAAALLMKKDRRKEHETQSAFIKKTLLVLAGTAFAGIVSSLIVCGFSLRSWNLPNDLWCIVLLTLAFMNAGWLLCLLDQRWKYKTIR